MRNAVKFVTVPTFTKGRYAMIQHFTFTVKSEHLPKNFPPDGLHIYDITDDIQSYLSQSGILNGFVIVQTLHTTLAPALNENETGLMRHDFPRLLRQIAPSDSGYYYEHDNFEIRTEFDPSGPERVNGHSHCRAILFSPSITLVILNGVLRLGTWQRVLLLEFDGHGRETPRSVAIMFDGE